MEQTLFRTVLPAGLVIDQVTSEEDHLVVTAHPVASGAACTECGETSAQVHSSYERRLMDLPSQGRTVRLLVKVRRFRCSNVACERKIFGERLGDGIAAKAGRRTSRLETIVHQIGIALGGRPAAGLARRPMLPVSRDTLLRVVRRRASTPGTEAVRVVGIDDFAWKRGQRYGTIVCDLQHRRIIDLLPDREAATVTAWLAAHPEITVVSRDRGGSYVQAATQGAPQAVQVADRWHLMENASAAFLEAVRRSMPSIRRAIGSRVVDPAQLTAAERLRHNGFLRRQDNNKVVKDLATSGASIKEIVRRTGRSRKLVRSVLRGEDGDVFRCRTHTLEQHLARLSAEWDAGCHNGAELWRRLRADGFKGGLRVVTEWATRRRRSEKAGVRLRRLPPSARKLSYLMSAPRERLTKEEAAMMATIETGVPMLASAHKLLNRFHRMMRTRDTAALAPWITESETSLLAGFCKGIKADLAAVAAALTEPWSNGQVEGQNTKLKLVKRQMYGRARLDLLRARLVVAA
jgi:transposase